MDVHYPRQDAAAARAPCRQNDRGQSNLPSLSLIIPAWNEEDSIRQAIEEAASALESITSSYEIIVVDDGSTDNTCEIVLSQAQANPRIRVVWQPRNIGYAAALRAGFQSARFELVALTDADCQFDLNDLKYMLTLTEHYDIVSGYRIDRKDPALRRFYSWGYNTLVRLLMGSGIRDIDCALKVFHRSQLLEILPRADNFFGNTEMFVEARRQGLSTIEVGVHHRPRAAGHSKVSLWAVPDTLKSLLPFWWTRTVFTSGARPREQGSPYFWCALFVLALVAGVLLFPKLAYPLIEPDEGRYAEIPHEMISSGDWIVPQLQSEPYLDKPPLLYWACACSYRMFGMTDWAARLVPAGAAFSTVLLTFVFGSRMLGSRSAFCGALLLTLSLGFVCCARFLILDSLLTLFVTLSLFAAYEAISGDRLRWSWWLTSGVACGLGVLTKGPVAFVLIAPPVLAHVFLCRPRVRPSGKQWAAHILTVLAVAAPWYAAMIARNPSFAYSFFWEHNVLRFLGGANHPQPMWYYIPVVILSWMPGGLLLFPLLVSKLNGSAPADDERPVQLGYFVLWAVWCVLFYSLSRGKLPPYILPAFPAMALLLGEMLNQTQFRRNSGPQFPGITSAELRRAILTLGIVGVVAGGGAWLLDLANLSEFLWQSALWSIALASLFVLTRRLDRRLLWGVFALMTFAIDVEVAHDLFPAWARKYAALPQSAPINDRLQDLRLPVACYGQHWGSIPFYLNRDNIHYFDRSKGEELARLVVEQGSAYLIVDHHFSLETMRHELPPGISVEPIATTRKVTVALLTSGKHLEDTGDAAPLSIAKPFERDIRQR